ncbi:MAG: hypothetical protein Q9P01_20190 [Anaerolineae bacterium]|nr:hypothetical protein [Anaerolineae bacterium]MDQ7037070.1 hypothetical protein [Anaerolineae bacterium]
MTVTQQNRILIIAFPLAIIAYLLPWAINTTTGLTLGGYDLAEWLSLHPATHPSRIPTLLLRGQLLILTLIIVWTTKKPLFTNEWWLRCIIVGLLVIAQLPPPEFLAWTGDQNQRQQALLAILSLIGGIVGLTGILYRVRPYLLIVVIIIGLLAVIYVLTQIQTRMQDFVLKATLGIGGISLIVVYVVLLVIYTLECLKANRGHE